MADRAGYGPDGSVAMVVWGFCLVMGASGIMAVLVLAVIRPHPARTWLATPCTIISSDYRRQRQPEPTYLPHIRYTYTFGDSRYESAATYAPEHGYAEFLPVQRLLSAYPPGTQTQCYVNPADPRQAALRRRTPWLRHGALAVAVGLLALGVGGLLGQFIGTRPAGHRSPLPPSAPLSPVVRIVRAIRWVVSLGMLAGGLALFLFFFSRPLQLLVISRPWAPVPATVVASGVQARQYPWGRFFRADVLYEYEVKGQRYRSNSYGPAALPTTDHRRAEELAERYPVGQQLTCLVAPHDPAQAMLDRSVPPTLVLAVFPLFLILAGLTGVWSLLGPIRPPTKERGLRRPPRELVLSANPLQQAVGLLVVAAIWNALIFPFVRAIVESFVSGRPAWLPALFVGVAAVIGIVLAIIAGAHFLALFNARPRLRLTPGDLVPEVAMTLHWRWRGRVAGISVLTITAICRRITVYHRHPQGSDHDNSSSDVTEEVYSQTLVTVTQESDIRAGSVVFSLPASVPHTATRGNPRHIWCLKVHGEIPGWPDVEREFAVEVTPP